MLNKLLPPRVFSAFPFTLLSAERLGKAPFRNDINMAYTAREVSLSELDKQQMD